MKIKYLYIIILFLFSFIALSQINDTLSRVYSDKELFNWVEKFIVDKGFIKKTKQGFVFGSDYTQTLSGRYSLHIIEELKTDTCKVILYRISIGSTAYHPGIIARVINKKNESIYEVFGIVPDKEFAHKLYAFFENYELTFKVETKLYCYNILFQNYYYYVNREVGVMPKKILKSKKGRKNSKNRPT